MMSSPGIGRQHADSCTDIPSVPVITTGGAVFVVKLSRGESASSRPVLSTAIRCDTAPAESEIRENFLTALVARPLRQPFPDFRRHFRQRQAITLEALIDQPFA